MSEDEASDDVAALHAMGYAQELARNMGRFSNFAISFSIICILSGGVNSLAQATSGAGGAAVGLGWPIGGGCALLFALGMAQIASAYPTAGGLYHWSSILGGRFWGWLTAWFNLIGLITVLAAINVGTFGFFVGAFGSSLHVSAGYWPQLIFMVVVTGLHGLVNHLGIKLTSRLTDLSGYLILGGAVLLTALLLIYAPSHHIERLWTFANYSGDAGGGVWPRTGSVFMLLMLGLLLPVYTLTGYDASAHTAEETVDASRNVPRGIIHAVIWASLFAWVLSCAFVIAIPDMKEAARQGWNVFFWVMDKTLPRPVELLVYAVIFVAQFLAGLATVTSVSRMIFAFARDDGLPASHLFKKVSPRFRTPVAAIWVGVGLAVAFTVYADAYSTVVSVTSIILYMSYAMPIAAGLFAYGRSWTRMGPWDMGPAYRIVAGLCIAVSLGIFYIGVQPPNGQALVVLLAIFAITGALWLVSERKRFKGPPIGSEIAKRRAEIAEAESLLDAAAEAAPPA
ncbi:amino acid permease [Phenylobacterium montanum]|uniref:Amino acid permease n=1 Tax=Phenylobacterium montanum TaxID=2823693 RepID=A0A975G028_9CAUL|nr:amino acid permease [Caulobacter sp. S6]QUD88309.1 amino acid permease [Caulobacter sp. S6]